MSGKTMPIRSLRQLTAQSRNDLIGIDFPLHERKVNADQVVARLRGQLARIKGATLFLQSVQDVRVGGRPTAAQYQYTLQADNVGDLTEWAPKLLRKLQTLP